MEQPSNQPTQFKRRAKSHLHPLSGLWVFAIDNVFFGTTMVTGGLTLPLSCALACCAGTLGVLFFQKVLARDSFGQTIRKAFIAGVICGLPFSIAGTVYGGWILTIAGLSRKNNPDNDQPSESQEDNNASH